MASMMTLRRSRESDNSNIFNAAVGQPNLP
jgi:hypothetical protein